MSGFLSVVCRGRFWMVWSLALGLAWLSPSPVLAGPLQQTSPTGGAAPAAGTETPGSGSTELDVPGARVLGGFSLEKVHDVANSQGSWVSMTVEPQGRLIVSDQYGLLYRVRIGAEGEAATVEPVNLRIGRAQGLLCAWGSLYVMAHAGDDQPSGLYRVRDTDGDDTYDSVELLLQIDGDGEHGPHAIVLSPDGKSLYLCAGNHTRLPELAASRVPRVWQEDQTLPRLWDASGHAVNIMAPGGWVVRCDPDGKQLELISIGFRNQYDIAFGPDGDLFTFDADMEWDIGLPWYRPTRVCHVTDGSEFGWRSGNGKWPDYFPDSLPPVLEIGPASPTGVTFGTGAAFPEKYQRALYVADWSYGVIYAVHLRKQGASFSAEREMLVNAPGLAVTDMVVNPQDGSLYFLIGGRKSRSALFRIRWTGGEGMPASSLAGAAADPEPNDSASEELHALRREIEQWLARPAEASKEVLTQANNWLANPDRHIRFAGRSVVERMPFADWSATAAAALADRQLAPRARLEWGLAVARCGDDPAREAAVRAILELDWNKLALADRLALLRVVGLVQARSTGSRETLDRIVCNVLEPRFPGSDWRTNFELCRVLVAARSTAVIEPAIRMMQTAPSQEQQIHYFLCLSHATTGWTPSLREQYFQWYLGTGGMRGGNSFAKFLSNLRDVAVSHMDEAERNQWSDWLARAPESRVPAAPVTPRPVQQKWTMADWTGINESSIEGRNLEQGRAMFVAGQCFQCHRMDGDGGSVGPDLTGAGRRFGLQDLLVALVEPSQAISDQYGATVFQLDDGRLLTGRVANLSGSFYMIQTNMLEPGNLTRVNVEEIVGQRPATTSMMPEGLLDSMTRDEVLDLLAYMRSAADRAVESQSLGR